MFNVNSLPEYVSVNKDQLLTKSIFGARTMGQINLQTGVKHKAAINVLSTDPVLQARTCGWDASGNVTFAQEYVEVGNYAVKVDMCEEDLREKYLNEEIKVKAGLETLPAEEKICANLVENIDRQVEDKLWNADKAAGDQFDGLLTQIKASAATDVASAATTVYGKIKDVYAGIPVEILDKAEIFVGIDDFRTLQQELVAANLYHFAPVAAQELEFVLPGSNTKIVAVSGLNGKHAIVAANPEYLYAAVDMADDAETFDCWYSKDHQTFKFLVKFNLGAKAIFADLIAYDA